MVLGFSRLPTATPLDKLLDGGLESGAITNIYGPPGSGKSNISMSAALACGKKVVWIDTEGSFSLERFRQLGGNDNALRLITLIEVFSWQQQHQQIQMLERLVQKEKVALIVVDSLVALYRLELEESNFQTINRQLATQYSILSKIARTYHIPVLVTNQVYSKGEEIELTSRMIGQYWSKCLIELRKLDSSGRREAILRKHRAAPENKRIVFEIGPKGLKEVRFSIF